jgi:predicted permease
MRMPADPTLVDKHSVCLFVCLLVCLFACFVCFFFFFFFSMLLIGHDLHHNCGLCVIGVFNLVEHCISLEIPVFNSCVGLKRLHLFD